MERFICFCVRRPVMVCMFLGGVLLGGLVSLRTLPLERLPNLSYPRLTVEALYPGMGAEDIRSVLTIPLEDALSSVKGLERMRSISRDGASLVVLDFRWGQEVNRASVMVREAIDGIYPSLPEGVQKPAVLPGDPNEAAHAIVALRPKNGNMAFARRLAEYELRSRLRSIDGLSMAVLSGGEETELSICLDLERIAALGISPEKFSRLLSGEIRDIPGGNAREGDTELVIVAKGRPDSAGDVSALVLPGVDAPFPLRDVAGVSEKRVRRKSIFVYQGEEQAALELYRRPGADPVRLSRDIKKVLGETERRLSKDAELTLVYDASGEITGAVRDLALSSLAGALSVACILVFFIRRPLPSVLAALSIPFSAASALAVLGILGKSLNSMSLSGLAMGVGLVSDVSVMVLDLLHRNFGEAKSKPGSGILAETVAAVSGSGLAGTLTTAVVFLPILFLPGPLGSLYGDLSIALVVSVASAWLYAQFCIPSLYGLFYRSNFTHEGKAAGGRLERTYRCLLGASIRKAPVMIALAALFSTAGTILLFSRPAVFIKADEAVSLDVSVDFPPGTNMEVISQKGIELEAIIKKHPCLGTVFGRAGAEDEDLARRAQSDYRKERLFFHCTLKKGRSANDVAGELSSSLMSSIPQDAALMIRPPQDRTEQLLGLSNFRTLAIKGRDRDELTERINRLKNIMPAKLGETDLPGVFRPAFTRPELRVVPKRAAAAVLGVSVLRLAELLYTATEGVVAGNFEFQGRPLDIRVSALQDINTKSLPETVLADLPVITEEGAVAFLDTLASLERREALAELARLDRSDVMYLDLAADTGEDILRLLLNEEGVSRIDESAFRRYKGSLVAALALVLLLLYMTLSAQFESFFLPLLLMLAIPFSLAGAGPALFVSGNGLDSGAVLGLVVLFGLAVNNSLVLHEIGQEKIRAGFPAVHGIYRGAAERFRPVLMTTLTTLCALLPLLVFPPGAGQRSMAAAMLGGIAASAALALLAMPILFIRYMKREDKS